jgi:RNA recognition motif-containing protein
MDCSSDNELLNAPQKAVKLFVGQIPGTIHETALNQFLSQYCVVKRVYVLRDENTNRHRRIDYHG